MTSDNPTQALTAFQPRHDFFLGVDSDGCVFDTMEIKHKECFIPNTVKHFGLQPVARYAREAAEFVNLYSRWRGVNRFPALIRTLDLLAEHPAVRARQLDVPRLPATRAWLQRETRLGNPALEAVVQTADAVDREELQRVLAWSQAVNQAVAELVCGVPPFPFVRESLACAHMRADIMVVSATPGEALRREWAEHDLAPHTAVIAGQETGTKAEQLSLAAGERYARDRILMIGDAPGDLQAARENGVRFYPISPGDEAHSWRRFLEEDLERFFAGQYNGAYEAERIAQFEAQLPDTPPWQQ